VARSEQLEAILRAQYELEYAEPEDWSRSLDHLNKLLDEAIADRSLTRRELLSVLRDRYKEYKRAQLLAEARRRSVDTRPALQAAPLRTHHRGSTRFQFASTCFLISASSSRLRYLHLA